MPDGPTTIPRIAPAVGLRSLHWHRPIVSSPVPNGLVKATSDAAIDSQGGVSLSACASLGRPPSAEPWRCPQPSPGAAGPRQLEPSTTPPSPPRTSQARRRRRLKRQRPRLQQSPHPPPRRSRRPPRRRQTRTRRSWPYFRPTSKRAATVAVPSSLNRPLPSP